MDLSDEELDLLRRVAGVQGKPCILCGKPSTAFLLIAMDGGNKEASLCPDCKGCQKTQEDVEALRAAIRARDAVPG